MNSNHNKLQFKKGEKAAILSALIVAVLSIMKGIIAILSGSVALLASTIHSLSDVFSSLLFRCARTAAMRFPKIKEKN